MNPQTVVLTVDGTLVACKGVIARLEGQFVDLPSGSVARVLVDSIPDRIDVRGWADRKGHRVVDEVRRGERIEILLVKGGPVGGPTAWEALGDPH